MMLPISALPQSIVTLNDIGEFIDAIEGLENSPTPELKKRQHKLPGS